MPSTQNPTVPSRTARPKDRRDSRGLEQANDLLGQPAATKSRKPSTSRSAAGSDDSAMTAALAAIATGSAAAVSTGWRPCSCGTWAMARATATPLFAARSLTAPRNCRLGRLTHLRRSKLAADANRAREKRASPKSWCFCLLKPGALAPIFSASRSRRHSRVLSRCHPHPCRRSRADETRPRAR